MFLSNGDFNFPFQAVLYSLKHFFMWSFQTGAPNADGIIRLPSILLNEAVFHLFGNVAVSYFYLALVTGVSLVAGYVFLKHFLEVRSRAVLLCCSLLFAINPVFLGNLSKTGLTLAAALLPLCLVAILKYFQTFRPHYLVSWILLLITSLVHPFTFAVNLLITILYFLYKWRKNGFKLGLRLWQIGVLGLLTIALCLFFVLPLAQIGSVSKDVLTQDIAPVKTDYTALVDIANTNGLANAFSLSRGVLKDYEFYNGSYKVFYIASIFALYTFAVVLFIRYKSKWSNADHTTYLVGMGALLGLLLLSTGTAFSIDVVIKALIGLPGGWMFRSPLKWQLYIPFFLMLIFAISLKYSQNRRVRNYTFVIFGICFVLMNGYLLKEISQKLLTPRSIQYFASLQKEDLRYKQMLVVSSQACNDFNRAVPALRTELNQIATSSMVQLKNAKADLLDNMQLNDYDYLIGCQEDLRTAVKSTAGYTLLTTAADKMAVYKNQKSKPYIYSFSALYSTGSKVNIAQKDNFMRTVFGEDFTYVQNMPKSSLATNHLDAAFEGITTQSIQQGVIRHDVPAADRPATLYATKNPGIDYAVKGNEVSFHKIDNPMMPLDKDSYDLTPGKNESFWKFSYSDKNYDYKNLVSNGSFERGLWKKKVGDCSAYDQNAKIAIRQTTGGAAEGQHALELTSSSHIACTDPGTLNVKPGAHYLLSFAYQNPATRAAGFTINFPNEGDSMSVRLDNTSDWQTHYQEIVVPNDMHELNLYFYAYPDSTRSIASVARYDNIKLIEVPDLQNDYYLVGKSREQTAAPAKTSYTFDSPTAKTVTIEDARQPFYLAMKDTYSDKWIIAGSTARQALHFGVNNGTNAWRIDPAELCKGKSSAASGRGRQPSGRLVQCQKHSDGSYNLTLHIEYAPQHWFVVGGIVSAAAWLASLGYIVVGWRQERRARKTA